VAAASSRNTVRARAPRRENSSRLALRKFRPTIVQSIAKRITSFYPVRIKSGNSFSRQRTRVGLTENRRCWVGGICHSTRTIPRSSSSGSGHHREPGVLAGPYRRSLRRQPTGVLCATLCVHKDSRSHHHDFRSPRSSRLPFVNAWTSCQSHSVRGISVRMMPRALRTALFQREARLLKLFWGVNHDHSSVFRSPERPS